MIPQIVPQGLASADREDTALIAVTKSWDDEDGKAMASGAWHDFRRSFASTLGEAGIPEAVEDAARNYRQASSRAGVLGVYQHLRR